MKTIRVAETDKPTNLLWTSGWDSTYRLLQLAVVLKKSVQPFYLIDSERDSLQAEIFSMQRIKQELRSRNPEAWQRVFPTIYIAVDDIPENPDIRAALDELRKTAYFGRQYTWFAELLDWKKKHVDYMEIGVYNTGNFHLLTNGKMLRVETEVDFWCEVDPDKSKTLYRGFGKCRFPIYTLDKIKVKKMAGDYGFLDLMYMTWFCYEPTKDMKPCGVCQICRDTMIDGMGERISKWRRFKGSLVWKWIEIKRFFKKG